MTLLSETAATQYRSARWHHSPSVCQLNNLCSLRVAQETNTYPSSLRERLDSREVGSLQRIYPTVGKPWHVAAMFHQTCTNFPEKRGQVGWHSKTKQVLGFSNYCITIRSLFHFWFQYVPQNITMFLILEKKSINQSTHNCFNVARRLLVAGKCTPIEPNVADKTLIALGIRT